MIFRWGGKTALPTKTIFQKSLQQNLKEFSVGSQIMGTVIPGALSFKLGTAYIAPVGGRALFTGASIPATIAPAATATIAPAAAASSAAGIGLGSAALATSGIGLASTAIKAGSTLWILDWLTKNWYIPALFLGGWIALKYVGGKNG